MSESRGWERPLGCAIPGSSLLPRSLARDECLTWHSGLEPTSRSSPSRFLERELDIHSRTRRRPSSFRVRVCGAECPVGIPPRAACLSLDGGDYVPLYVGR